MKRTNRWIAAVLTTGIAATLVPAGKASASPEGRRNTALAATAAAAYLTYQYAQKPSQGRLIPAAAAAGAAGYLWVNHSNKSKAEKQRERAALIAYGRRHAYRNGSYRTAGYRGKHGRRHPRGHAYGHRR